MTAQALSQTPNPLNLNLRQNQIWNQSFAYCLTDANGNYDLNLPIDITGYTPLLQFRTSALAKTAALTATVENGGIEFVGDVCPQVKVSVGINCAPGKYQWDLRLIPIDPTQSIYLGQGYVIVQAEVSR